MMTNKMKETMADYLPDGYRVVEDGSPIWRLLTSYWATGVAPNVNKSVREWIPYTEKLQDGRQVDLGRMSTMGKGWNVYRFHVYRKGNPYWGNLSERTQIFIVSPATYSELERTAATTVDSVMARAEEWFGPNYVIVTEESRAWPAAISIWKDAPIASEFRRIEQFLAPSSDLEPSEHLSDDEPRVVHVGMMELRRFGQVFLVFSTKIGRFMTHKQFKPMAFAVHKSTALVMAEASDWGAFDKNDDV